ncbi:signal peptidase I [Halorubrum halophilum]|uniref:signal peptidase I n=1 Tax=Halorubrum halophilum TaxID=413816 RepID=UPI00186B480A|nr:signal peptidase I [Halorubrum halophilum]
MTTILTSARMKRAANILGIVLLIALVTPFAVYAVPEVVSADESFVVLTPSMTPAIAPGDVVVVAERDPATVAVGDVITFMRGTSDVPVTHRVIGVVETANGLAFETMGDANEGPDPGLVPAANLVGVVALTIPYIGFVIQFAGTPAGFVTLVLLPFGLLAVTEIWSLVQGRNGAETVAAADASDDPDATDDPDASAGSASPTAAAAVAESPADSSTESSTDATAVANEATNGGVSVDAIGGAAAMLALFAPYAIYIAFELRTAAPIAVAIGSTTLLLGALAIWVPASGVLSRSASTGASAPADPEPVAETGATDGGDVESPAETDSSAATESSDAVAETESVGEAAPADETTAETADGHTDPFTSPDSLDGADPTAGSSVTPPAQADRTGEGD